jgi:hypothetical protein
MARDLKIREARNIVNQTAVFTRMRIAKQRQFESFERYSFWED